MITWRIARPDWLCKRHGHIPALGADATCVAGFFLCGCGNWYPLDDVFDPGTKEDGISQHPRYDKSGMSNMPLPKGTTVSRNAGQPPLTFDMLDRMPTPFMHLRDNPEELGKMDFKDIRRLIIDRLADYEEGMDA